MMSLHRLHTKSTDNVVYGLERLPMMFLKFDYILLVTRERRSQLTAAGAVGPNSYSFINGPRTSYATFVHHLLLLALDHLEACDIEP